MKNGRALEFGIWNLGELQYDVEMVLRSATSPVCAKFWRQGLGFLLDPVENINKE